MTNFRHSTRTDLILYIGYFQLFKENFKAFFFQIFIDHFWSPAFLSRGRWTSKRIFEIISIFLNSVFMAFTAQNSLPHLTWNKR